MRTTHEINIADARAMSGLEDDSVDLIVTSPPYPMIEMWDATFAKLDSAIARDLEEGAGLAAFDGMHAILDQVWIELDRVLDESGIVCVNVGDATRRLGDRFRLYPNHARIVDAFRRIGFDVLPDVIWHKPTNSGTKFLGSGMLPTNAYITLEHEYILVFRKGGPRRFQPGDDDRYESAYFWEERNEWFSDRWMDIKGTEQVLEDEALRDRSGAFPFELPYRLINMYSTYGDTVLDPFWGTGTTTLAAMASGRNSIGYELDATLVEAFDPDPDTVQTVTDDRVATRIEAHESYVTDHQDRDRTFDYRSKNYDVPVRTKQERHIRFYRVEAITENAGSYIVDHTPVDR